jgi:hypothetical protein
MTQTFYLDKEIKVYLENDAGDYYRIEVTAAPEFSQSASSESVSVNTMPQSNATNSITGLAYSSVSSKVFKTEFEPASWSFTTHVRPFLNSGASQAAESILWEFFTGSNQSVPAGQTNRVFSLAETYPTFTLHFIYPDNRGYKISGCVISRADISVDINATGTISWSGSGIKLEDESSFPSSPTIQNSSALTGANYITNKLSTLTSTNSAAAFNFPITAMSISMSVEHQPITSPILAELTYPIGFSRKNIEVTGNFAAYVISATGAGTKAASAALRAGNDPVYDVSLNIGGTTTNKNIVVVLSKVFIQTPSYSSADALTFSCDFIATGPVILGGVTTPLAQIKYT